jgi:hypothetical protein
MALCHSLEQDQGQWAWEMAFDPHLFKKPDISTAYTRRGWPK